MRTSSPSIQTKHAHAPHGVAFPCSHSCHHSCHRIPRICLHSCVHNLHHILRHSCRLRTCLEHTTNTPSQYKTQETEALAPPATHIILSLSPCLSKLLRLGNETAHTTGNVRQSKSCTQYKEVCTRAGVIKK